MRVVQLVDFCHCQVRQADEQADQEVPQTPGGQQRQRRYQRAPGQREERHYQCL